MTLKQIIKYINDIAAKQPNINHIIESGNIYDLNTDGKIKYSAFCLTQQVHTEVEGFRTYNFYFFYVDRLLTDNSNKIAVQSAAIETLSNIINTLRQTFEIEINDNINYQVFTQRFASECAGAYTSVSITVPITSCATDYE